MVDRNVGRPTPPGRSGEAASGEQDRLRRIAKRHGLAAEPLAVLIMESRAEARLRRRRLSDGRLEELIAALGGDRR